MSRKKVENSNAGTEAVGHRTETDRGPSNTDIVTEVSDVPEFFRRVKEYFDKAGADRAYFYVARQAVQCAWRFRGVPGDTERHKLARNLARLGHAALKAHRRGDSSLAGQWWLDTKRTYKDLSLMCFAGDRASAQRKLSRRQSTIARKRRKPGLAALNEAIVQEFERLVQEREEPGFPTNNEVLARIGELADSGNGLFEKDPGTGRIEFVVFVTFRIPVTYDCVKGALRGKRPKSEVSAASHG